LHRHNQHQSYNSLLTSRECSPFLTSDTPVEANPDVQAMFCFIIMPYLFRVFLKCDLTKTARYKLLEYREKMCLKPMDYCLHGICCLSITHLQKFFKSTLAFSNIAQPFTELLITGFDIGVFREEHSVPSCVIFLFDAVLIAYVG
jgi:hypothetical protein